MPKSHFFRGSLVKSRCRFRNYQNQLVDPTGVTCTLMDPTGNETDYEYGVDAELTKSETGVYLLEIDTTDHSGEYRVKWLGTGSNQAAVDGIFYAYSPFEGEDMYGR